MKLPGDLPNRGELGEEGKEAGVEVGEEQRPEEEAELHTGDCRNLRIAISMINTKSISQLLQTTFNSPHFYK